MNGDINVEGIMLILDRLTEQVIVLENAVLDLTNDNIKLAKKVTAVNQKVLAQKPQ